MNQRIQLLDDVTINQIAAGEVVENAASVVKELVENAIDSGASAIAIELEGNGRTLIRIQDNGCGMSDADAALSMARHATSKLRHTGDLAKLHTMGFRGEALASIASISQLSIMTAEHEAGSTALPCRGRLVQAQAGVITSSEATQCLGGTVVEVRSLFYNVPARLKFQRSPAKELHEVMRIVTQLALAHPEIQFDLIVNQKRELFSPVHPDPAARLHDLLGKELFSRLTPIAPEAGISGYVGTPGSHRTTRTGQYLFLNKRPIISPLISHAVKEAYGSAIDPQQHPIFVLFLSLPPDEIDINVHPQKREARFHREALFRSQCREVIARTLFPQFEIAASEVRAASEESKVRAAKESPPPLAVQTRPFALSLPSRPAPPPELLEKETTFRLIGVYRHYAFVEIMWSADAEKKLPRELGGDGFYLVDLEQLRFRLLFDQMIQETETGPEAESLLVPLFMECSPSESASLRRLSSYLEKQGLSMREFGPNAFLIETVPSAWKGSDIEAMLKAIAASGEEELSDATQRTRNITRLAARLSACTKPPQDVEARWLIKKGLASGNPFITPAAEPIFFLFTHEYLIRKFHGSVT